MRTKILFLILSMSLSIFAQEDAWIYFRDKPNSPTFFANPLSELTQRSLDRRTAQNITLDLRDAPLHQPYVDQITAATGITVLAKSKWLNMLHIRGTQTDIQALLGLGFVDRVQYANHSLNRRGSIVTNQENSAYVDKWSESNSVRVNYDYGNSATQIQMLNAHILHQNNFTGTGKVVAVFDTGFPGVNTTAPFASLRNRGLILGGYDFVNNSNNFYTGYQHGTQVLSNMGGNATNLVGTSPDASYYLFITEDINSETPLELSNWVEAAEESDRLGVDVINSSLGYFAFDNPVYSYTYAKMNGQTSVAARAVDIAFSKGMICVISAGNDGANPEPHISTPADATLAVTVGSVTSTRTRSGFSSIGPSADGRIKPDLMAMGSASVVATQTGAITTNNGTSFSGPILAGAITSFWSAFPNKTNAEIVQLVKASADRFNNPDNNYGYGIPNFQLALNNALGTVKFGSDAIKVFPNPVNDEIIFELPLSNVNSELVFYNSLGQEVLRKTLKNTFQKFRLDNLSNGIYYYTLSSSDKVAKGKIVKN